MRLTANDLVVHAATVTLPRVGRWTADLDVIASSAATLAGAVTLETSDGSLRLAGTAWAPPGGTVGSGTTRGGRTTVRVVGGAGGLEKEVAPKFFDPTPLRIVLEDLLGALGETLSATSDAATLGLMLERWPRARGSGLGALGRLLAAAPAGTTWRVLDDGSIWVGPEAFPVAELAATDLIVEENPEQTRMRVGVAAPTLRPGVTLLDRKVSLVRYLFKPAELVAEVEFEASSSFGADAVGALVRRELETRGDLYGVSYDATVFEQRANGTLDLTLSSSDMPSLTGIDYRPGLPGVSIKAAPGARCTVKFLDRDPRKPVICGWDKATDGLTELSFDDGTQRVAREGDSVNAGWIQVVAPAGGGACTITYLPASIPLAAGFTKLDEGQITEGADKVLA